MLVDLPVDVIVDATGVPDVGALISYAALTGGKDVATLNAEADVTIGLLLSRVAHASGQVYAVCKGDEPVEVKALFDFVTDLGFEVVCAGKGKNNPLRPHDTPDSVADEAAAKHMNPKMLASFVDGTKTMIECACMANGTGLELSRRGMYGPETTVPELANVFRPAADGGVLDRPGVVDYATGPVAPGVFVVGRSDHPTVIEEMAYLSMGPGPYYAFYRPYHLASLEAPLTVATAALDRVSTLEPVAWKAEVVATAKRDLRARGPDRRHWRQHRLRGGRLGRGGRGRGAAAARPGGQGDGRPRRRHRPAAGLRGRRAGRELDHPPAAPAPGPAAGPLNRNRRGSGDHVTTLAKSADDARRVLATMWTIRRFEEAVDEMFARGLLYGTMHLSIGQEASATGACLALRDDDVITSTHRGHGHCIAKGADLGRMMAELLARDNGYCRGRGGSMHIADVTKGNLGANGIVAGGIPIAVGAGLAHKLQGSDKVALSFFGDGATSEGAFHESVNLAAIWDLPVVFVCENNHYGMSMSVTEVSRLERVADRAAGYGIPGVTVDGNDVDAVHKAAAEAVAHARSGQGPTLVEAVTYRWKGHSKSDQNLYRTREEIDSWRARDPIERFEQAVLKAKTLSEDELKQVRDQARDAVRDAVRAGQTGPPPSPDLLAGVYAPSEVDALSGGEAR